jgi:hypothetical protein
MNRSGCAGVIARSRCRSSQELHCSTVPLLPGYQRARPGLLGDVLSLGLPSSPAVAQYNSPSSITPRTLRPRPDTERAPESIPGPSGSRPRPEPRASGSCDRVRRGVICRAFVPHSRDASADKEDLAQYRAFPFRVERFGRTGPEDRVATGLVPVQPGCVALVGRNVRGGETGSPDRWRRICGACCKLGRDTPHTVHVQ